MKNRLALLLVALASTACASIAGGGTSQSLALQSTPPGATFTVKSSTGLQMASAQAPNSIKLPRKNEYQIEVTAPGYQPQTISVIRGVNGWFWANIFLTGLVGIVIDAADGAMWKLEPALVSATLIKGATGQNGAPDDEFAIIRLFDKAGHQLSEQHLKLVPVR